MGFGAEFKNMRALGGAPKLTEDAVKTAEVDATARANEKTPEADLDSEIFAQPFVDGQTLGETAPATEGEAPVIPPPKPETKKAVKLNGKTFETVEEAMEYAAELERTVEKEEAFKKGLEAAKPKEVKPAEKKKILKVAEKLFENPEEAFEELEGIIEEMANRIVDQKDNQKTQAQVQAESIKQTWDNFYKTNNDLADWQDEVNLVTQREWDRLQHLPAKEGLEEIANLARAYVSSVKERALPKSVLNSRPAQTASGGTKATTATQTPATKEKVSFSQQVRSTNRRTAMQGEV